LKTYSMKLDEIAKDWLLLDADDVVLGRLATQVATFLRGKHKPTFTAHLDMGDNVIVLNAAKVKLTGQKREKKVYLRHTGYMGGQRVTTMSKLMETRPEDVIMRAVKAKWLNCRPELEQRLRRQKSGAHNGPASWRIRSWKNGITPQAAARPPLPGSG